MRLRYSQRADNDIYAIVDYLRAGYPTPRSGCMTKLRALPRGSSSIHSAASKRVLFVGRYPYKIFYRVDGEIVEILHVRPRHAGRSISTPDVVRESGYALRRDIARRAEAYQNDTKELIRLI